jgi:hypothetical protein
MHYYLALEAFQERDFITAARQAEISGDLWDDDRVKPYLVVLRAAALAESDEAARAVALLVPLLEAGPADSGVRAGVLDNLAWAYLLTDEPEKLDQGLELVAEACAHAPWDVSFQISRACLLAASAVPGDDRAQVAHELIRELGKQSLRGQNAAYAALARGLIAAVRGDPSARREYENAKSLHATVAPLRVLERRLPSR